MHTFSELDERIPLYERVRADLLACLARGEWRPGEAIPTESELTRRYGVAVGTVRKALDGLAGDGILVRSQGKGTYVRRPSFDASLFRFFRFKGKNGISVVPTARILSRTQAIPPASVVRALGLPREACLCIGLVRERLIDGRPVLYEQIWLPYERFDALSSLELDAFGDLLYPLYEQTCGQSVASAREALTVQLADEETRQSLALAPAEPVVVIERIASDFSGTPIEWRRTQGGAAGFRYEIDIR